MRCFRDTATLHQHLHGHIPSLLQLYALRALNAVVPGFAPIPQGPVPTPIPTPCEPAAAGVAMNLAILHINDHHSHLEADTFKLKGADVPAGLSVTTSDVRVTYGGFPMLVSLFEKVSPTTTSCVY